ncbi:MAG: hypothetical protein Q8P41_32315 [Pseudomonadota bacterium]|nr:hypothetical protein [Pseudomonadota bacterium]
MSRRALLAMYLVGVALLVGWAVMAGRALLEQWDHTEAVYEGDRKEGGPGRRDGRWPAK